MKYSLWTHCLFLIIFSTNNILAQESSTTISTQLISSIEEGTNYETVYAQLNQKGVKDIAAKDDILTWNNVFSDQLINPRVVTFKDENTHYRLFF